MSTAKTTISKKISTHVAECLRVDRYKDPFHDARNAHALSCDSPIVDHNNEDWALLRRTVNVAATRQSKKLLLRAVVYFCWVRVWRKYLRWI